MSSFDFVLALDDKMSGNRWKVIAQTYGEENEDVTFGLGRVDLEDGCNGSMEVVGFRLRSVMDIYRVSASRYWKV